MTELDPTEYKCKECGEWVSLGFNCDCNIKQCPKCNSEIDYRGAGEYIYGAYEYYEWFCTNKECNYCEGQYSYDQTVDKEVKK